MKKFLKVMRVLIVIGLGLGILCGLSDKDTREKML